MGRGLSGEDKILTDLRLLKSLISFSDYVAENPCIHNIWENMVILRLNCRWRDYVAL
jgi:hypothetical protein